MVSSSKGWHNESLRHSEAKRFGKASVGKVSAPKPVKSISNKSKSKYSKGLNNLVIQKDKLLKSIDDLDDKKLNRHIATKQERKKDHYLSSDSYVYGKSKSKVVSFADKKKALVRDYDKLNNKEIQTSVDSLAEKYNVDGNKLLNEIIVAHNYKTTKLRNEYIDSKTKPIKSKPNVVSISNKNISVGEAVTYHNKEASKSLKKEDYSSYRYHKSEAIKLNQKARLLSLKK